MVFGLIFFEGCRQQKWMYRKVPNGKVFPCNLKVDISWKRVHSIAITLMCARPIAKNASLNWHSRKCQHLKFKTAINVIIFLLNITFMITSFSCTFDMICKSHETLSVYYSIICKRYFRLARKVLIFFSRAYDEEHLFCCNWVWKRNEMYFASTPPWAWKEREK